MGEDDADAALKELKYKTLTWKFLVHDLDLKATGNDPDGADKYFGTVSSNQI